MVRWESGRRSDNVEDRRGSDGPRRKLAGGGLGMILMLVVVYFASGGNLGKVLQVALQQGVQAPPVQNANPNAPADPREEQLKEFVSVILGYTEDVWREQFPKISGGRYREPTLVFFRGSDQSACGFASAATGPFYCPADEKVYIDLAFYDELANKFDAPGDFAQAYVIAHEVGHHVQKLLGLTEKVHRMQQSMGEAEANELSVALELQADFLAGVWAHHAQKTFDILERGDIEEGLNAASMIGDDTLQKRAQGYVVPESFTHGSADQRVHWFKKGLQSGDVSQMMGTFNGGL